MPPPIDLSTASIPSEEEEEEEEEEVSRMISSL